MNYEGIADQVNLRVGAKITLFSTGGWENNNLHSLFTEQLGDSDPICQLSKKPLRHSRLCTVILNSSPFVNIVVETASTKILDHQCSKLDITFVHETPGAYYEWMIQCKAESLETKNPVYYYISRAYKRNTVLIYDADYDSKGKLVLINASTNVNISP